MDFLTEVGKQVPSLSVLVFVVVAFLRHSRMYMEAMRTLSMETNEAIRENTRVIGENNVLLARAVDNNDRIARGHGMNGHAHGECEDD